MMKMPSRVDIKYLHSKELRELRTMIREELDFRAECYKESSCKGASSEVAARYVDELSCLR